jgi:iron only hydrogenase large subunit-like protein
LAELKKKNSNLSIFKIKKNTEFGSPDFFGFAYNENQLTALKIANGKKKSILMVAPSFVADFSPQELVRKARGLGFELVVELTFGAKIVNLLYHEFIKKNSGKKDFFISSVCPASVLLIKNKYPQFTKYLLPFVSPMVAMAKILKKNYPKHKIVFMSPCSAKKIEAKSSKEIDEVITFIELKQMIAKEKPKSKGSGEFDSFYNSYTSIYPLAGGLAATLNKKGILSADKIVSCDGCVDIEKLFSNNPNSAFYDILFCKGGCIGGNGIASKTPLLWKKLKVLSYRKKKRVGKNGKVGLEKYTKGINFSKKI